MFRGAQLSVSQLSSFHDAIATLRGRLHAAMVDEEPRLEMSVYNALDDIVVNKLRHCCGIASPDTNLASSSSTSLLCTEPTTPPTPPHDEDARLQETFIVMHYLQDIFAALLFLLDEEQCARTGVDLATPLARPAASSNVSLFYVSQAQRVYCGRLFFHLCFATVLPTYRVMEALYPLLDLAPRDDRVCRHEREQDGRPDCSSRGGADAQSTKNEASARSAEMSLLRWEEHSTCGNGDTNCNAQGSAASTRVSRAGDCTSHWLENQSVPNMLCRPRFRHKRALLSAVLQGVVLSPQRGGVTALIRVFMLDDRVRHGATAEASAHVTRAVMGLRHDAEAALPALGAVSSKDNSACAMTAAAAAAAAAAAPHGRRVGDGVQSASGLCVVRAWLCEDDSSGTQPATAPPADSGGGSGADAVSTTGGHACHRRTLTMRLRGVTEEERMRRVGAQLVPLLSHMSAPDSDADTTAQERQHGDKPDSVATTTAATTPTTTWRDAMAQAHRGCHALPRETRAERLDVCLTHMANAATMLPRRDGDHAPRFAAAYRRFFYFTRYILTPAFRPLRLYGTLAHGGDAAACGPGALDCVGKGTGRAAPDTMEQCTTRWTRMNRQTDTRVAFDRTHATPTDTSWPPPVASEHTVVQALWRLHTLAHGAALQTSSHALVCVLDAVAPALLNLTALPMHRLPRRLSHALRTVWQRLVQEEALEAGALAHVLVHRGCAALPTLPTPTARATSRRTRAPNVVSSTTSSSAAEEAASAEIAVTGQRTCLCFGVTAHAVERELCVSVGTRCGRVTRLRGLARVVFGLHDAWLPNGTTQEASVVIPMSCQDSHDGPPSHVAHEAESDWSGAPATLQHATLSALIDVAAVWVSGSTTHEPPTPTVCPDRPTGRRDKTVFGADAAEEENATREEDWAFGAAVEMLIERVCTTAAATVVFGPCATLPRVCGIIQRVLPLGALCVRWAAGLVPRVLAHYLARTAASSNRTSCARNDGVRGGKDAVAEIADAVRGNNEDSRVLGRALEQLQAALQQRHAACGNDVAEDDLCELLATAQAAVDEASHRCRTQTRTRPLSDRVGISSAEDEEEEENNGTLNTIPAGKPVTVLHSSLQSLLDQLLWALEVHSVTMAAIQLAHISRALDEAVARGLRLQPASNAAVLALRRMVSHALMPALMRAMMALREDACAVSHAIRCWMWVGMYRLDSVDSMCFSVAMYELLQLQPDGAKRAALTTAPSFCHSQRAAATTAETNNTPALTTSDTAAASSSSSKGTTTARPTTSLTHNSACAVAANAKSYSCMALVQSRVGLLHASAVARIRVCALDVLLALCDYDTAGHARTLRNMNDCLSRQGRSIHTDHHCSDTCSHCSDMPRMTLFELLRELCLPDKAIGQEESAVVQIAALHLIGHYMVAVYPIVPLGQVCQLCRDVFRHTTLEMAKAACASMLLNVVVAVETNSAGVVGDVDLADLHTLASAMAGYMWPGNVARAQAPAGRCTNGLKVTREEQASRVDEEVEVERRAREHAMVVSRHGKEILTRLRHLFAHTLVSEMGNNLLECNA